MLQQGNGGAFGRRPLAGAPLIAAPPKPPAAAPSNPIVKFFDRVFLWLPNEQSPGFLCGLPVSGAPDPAADCLAAGASYVVLALFAPANFNPLQHSSTSPNWYVVLIVPFALACIALVQELSRYAFVRRANNPVRAVSIFTAVVIASLLIVYHDSLYTCAWTIAAQLAASAAIIYALRYRPYIHAAVVGLSHLPDGGQCDRAGSFPAAASRRHPHAAREGQRQRPVDGKHASLGQTLSRRRPDQERNLEVHEPDRVERGIHRSGFAGSDRRLLPDARERRSEFSNTQVILGYHRFTQDSTNNDFSYMVTTDATGSCTSYSTPGHFAGAVRLVDNSRNPPSAPVSSPARRRRTRRHPYSSLSRRRGRLHVGQPGGAQ